eukprot:CAMPEP_0198227466 /NCGR_PEP_ID=MMETSP1445-20131203/109333_1 /TAXON_ID=36898 /ORGANISM="Pyramimonas sp., Strain CCMP2087" /LENGTH=310 /DNA_ID=CAMNT_0043907539 /DNA_START=159 /DNA_END=1088 /DNA_ORIENTATION=-
MRISEGGKLFSVVISVFLLVNACKGEQVDGEAQPFSRLAAGVWSLSSFPNPMTQKHECGRGNVAGTGSKVCDPEGVLSFESANVVENTLNTIQTELGLEMAVAVMRTLASGPTEESMRHFAKGLHDQWGVGSRDKNDGILLVLAVDDRQVYISTGRGAKDQLPDNTIDQIIARMKPSLKKADYDAAVEKAVREVGQVLSSGALDDESTWLDRWGGWLFFAVILLVMLGGPIKEWFDKQNYKKCKAQLESLDSARKRAASNIYASTSCPICMENFPEEPKTEAKTDTNQGDTSGQADVAGDEIASGSTSPP